LGFEKWRNGVDFEEAGNGYGSADLPCCKMLVLSKFKNRVKVPWEKLLRGKVLASVPETGEMHMPPSEPWFVHAERMRSSAWKLSVAVENV
jgi:hypothetical protein